MNFIEPKSFFYMKTLTPKMNDELNFNCAEFKKCCTNLRKPARTDAMKVLDDMKRAEKVIY